MNKIYIPTIILLALLSLWLWFKPCTPEVITHVVPQDNSQYLKSIDSLNCLLEVQSRKKNPLLSSQKRERKRVDSLVTVYVQDSTCQEDSLIVMLYQERLKSDSVVQAYREDSTLYNSKIVLLEKQVEKGFKRESELVDTCNKLIDSNLAKDGKIAKLKRQRNISLGGNALQLLLRLIGF